MRNARPRIHRRSDAYHRMPWLIRFHSLMLSLPALDPCRSAPLRRKLSNPWLIILRLCIRSMALSSWNLTIEREVTQRVFGLGNRRGAIADVVQ